MIINVPFELNEKIYSIAFDGEARCGEWFFITEKRVDEKNIVKVANYANKFYFKEKDRANTACIQLNKIYEVEDIKIRQKMFKAWEEKRTKNVKNNEVLEVIL